MYLPILKYLYVSLSNIDILAIITTGQFCANHSVHLCCAVRLLPCPMLRCLLLLTICAFPLFTSAAQLNQRQTAPLIHHRRVNVCAGTSPLYIAIHKESWEKVTELKIDVAKTIVKQMYLASVCNFSLIWVATDSRSEWQGPLNDTETLDLLANGPTSMMKPTAVLL